MTENDPSDVLMKKYGSLTKLAGIAITAFQKRQYALKYPWHAGNIKEGESAVADEKKELINKYHLSASKWMKSLVWVKSLLIRSALDHMLKLPYNTH